MLNALLDRKIAGAGTATVEPSMSPIGTKLTYRDLRYQSVYEAEADMPNIPADFR